MSSTVAKKPSANAGRQAASWAEFVAEVRKAKKDLGGEAVWYRGQSRIHYELVPSLLRQSQGIKLERALFDEYERYAGRLFAKRTNDWELLIDMQHFGISTRLLDWTDTLGIAVAFALYDSHDDVEDSAIYVLNPTLLNKLSGQSEIKRVPNDTQFEYKSIYWHGRPLRPTFPIAIDCAFQNDRIAAQNGTFTVHGSNLLPLDKQNPTSVRRIVLPATIKKEARMFLEDANLNPFSIYPDTVGMARHIMRKFFD